jgi:hypothetical protein
MPIARTLNQDFFKVWTPDMAYVLGYFAADGSMLKNARGAFFIEFTSIDRILIEQLRAAVGSNHTISVREKGGNYQTAYRIQIGSKAWFKDLTEFGFTQHKSNSMIFPKVPEEYLGEFVRGYFDGDGCVYFKNHFAKDRNKERWFFMTLFTSGSKPFLNKLWSRLEDHGIQGGHISEKTKGGYDLVLSRHDSLALYRLMYNTGFNTGLYLPRKHSLFVEAIMTLYGNDCVRS